MNIILVSIIGLVLVASQAYLYLQLRKSEKRVDSVIENFVKLSDTLQKALKDYDKSLDEKVSLRMGDLKLHVDTALKAVSKRIGKREKASE
jgi:Mg2+ and Co2+ transporter CorA